MDFYGTYREVTPPSRLVWTNEEGGAGETVTTVTFDEKDGKTLLVVHDNQRSSVVFPVPRGPKRKKLASMFRPAKQNRSEKIASDNG